MPPKIDLPAAWRGEELFARDDWTVELSESDLAELDAALESSLISSGSGLANRLSSLQNSLERGGGATRVRGFPIDRYDEAQARTLFRAICERVGTPISQSASGETMFSVRDEGFGENDPRTRGPNTRKKLSFHTDRCDVIAFLCLRQAKSGGENFVVSSVSLFNEIGATRPDLLGVLMAPFFYKRHNVDAGNERPYCEQPIFSVFDGHFAANFLRVLIERAYASNDVPDMTEQQREALDYVETLAEDPRFHVSFRLESGDLLFLNNWVTFHRRSEFVDHDDVTLRRHLLRVWLSVPNSRPLNPMFAGNYGATAAGAIRGGMHPPG